MKLFMRNETSISLVMLMMTIKIKMMMIWLMGMEMGMGLGMSMTMGMRINASVAATNRTCKHATNMSMWGDPNPNIFYVCTAADQMPLQLQCPQGRGFFNGHGHLGCLPYDQWPACRPNSQLDQQLVCDSSGNVNTMQQPWPTMDPNQFYMCPGVNTTPLLLSCAPGKGFVQTAQSVGCADWPHWRRQMECEQYF